jgi:hypothetical protein
MIYEHAVCVIRFNPSEKPDFSSIPTNTGLSFVSNVTHSASFRVNSQIAIFPVKILTALFYL